MHLTRGCTIKYQMLLSASWWSRRRLQEQTTGLAPHGPAARPLRAFFARGVTPAPSVQVASMVHHVELHPMLLTNPSGLSQLLTLHLTSSIINHRHFTPFRFFFPIFHVILPSFHVKNGSFQPIQIHTGALLAPPPQIALFFHYNRELTSIIATIESIGYSQIRISFFLHAKAPLPAF